jgi:hypothetical protein
LVCFQCIDVAIFKHAFGKRQLSCATVNEQRAFDELATVKADKNAFAPKIKMLGLKAFAPYYAFFRGLGSLFRLQPQFDQPAHGLGTIGQIGLFPAPIIKTF